jgi:hypothetical protein
MRPDALRRRLALAAISVTLFGALAACAATRPAPLLADVPMSCPAPLQPYLRTALYTGAVADSAWHRFISEVLIEHFPVGGSVFENTGWWRRPDGTMYRNAGKTLVILAPVTETEQHRAAVRAVIAAFKQRFNHRSVGWEEDRLCAGF